MRCPCCGSIDDKVIESRTMANGESIRRRRECISCGYRFTSYEKIEEKPFMVIKKDGSRQPFERAKLAKGIERSFEKRSVATGTIENIVLEIEDEAIMSARTTREISTQKIGEIVMRWLYKTDKVAYIRFASAYKHFESLEEFINEIKSVEENKQ